MTPELLLLCGTAASIGVIHTLLGPDHYLPFVALAKARGWSLARTLRVTLACGIGHIIGSIVLGVVGIAAGIQLASLEWVEGLRGDLAAWALIAFGLCYLSWGLRQAWRKRPHAHWHRHGGALHRHVHDHRGEHSHVHTASDRSDDAPTRTVTAWAIFVVFVLGPCEPLIPVLMFPAARESVTGVVAVAGIYALATVVTMLFAVAATCWGMQRLQLPGLNRYGQAIAGGVILCCGLGIAVLGL